MLTSSQAPPLSRAGRSGPPDRWLSTDIANSGRRRQQHHGAGAGTSEHVAEVFGDHDDRCISDVLRISGFYLVTDAIEYGRNLIPLMHGLIARRRLAAANQHFTLRTRPACRHRLRAWVHSALRRYIAEPRVLPPL